MFPEDSPTLFISIFMKRVTVGAGVEVMVVIYFLYSRFLPFNYRVVVRIFENVQPMKILVICIRIIELEFY